MMLRALLFLALATYTLAEIQEIVPLEQTGELTNQTDAEVSACGFCRAQAGPIDHLYYNSGMWINIFVDVKFRCRGPVTKWEYFAKLRGRVYFTVWRPRPNGKGWRLVGKNLVRARRRGPNVHWVPRNQQIFARRGDVIGIQYPRNDPDAEVPTERGVVPYENDGDFQWDNPPRVLSSFPFSRIHNKQVWDEDIHPRKTRRGLRHFKRRAALAAFIGVKNPCQPNPCQNGGTCSIDGDDYECECPPDFVGKDCEDEVECELAGGPLENLAYDSGIWLNIFTEFTFPCSGRIVEWRFYAKKTGQMYLTAWRPNGGDSFTILGKNLITVDDLGINRVPIDRDEQIEVLAGDVFGIHYPEGGTDGADSADDRGIIPYVDNRPGGAGLCCGVTEDRLSELYNVNIQDDTITANPTQDGDHIRGFKRAVALSALVHQPLCGLQLGPRTNLSYNSGRWLNVFVDRPVGCSGKVVRWEFFAKKTGDIFLSVWRGNIDSGFRMRAKTRFTVTSLGTHVMDLEGRDRLPVFENDVLGIHYPDQPAGEDDRGIIPYRNDDDFPWWTAVYEGDEVTGLEDEFFNIHNVDIQDSEIGRDYLAGPPYRPFKRIPAFAVYVDEDTAQTVQVL